MIPAAPAGVADIDWSRPWLAPYRELGEPISRGWQQATTVACALNAAARTRAVHLGSALPRFVPAEHLPRGEAYEAFIARTRSVPTRDNLHDFFNGLVWLHRPALKWAMNRMQAGEIARAGIGRHRGPLRDALTLFDENGALLGADPSLAGRLAARDWHALFIAERAHWRQAQLLLVGHALLEKLVQPRKAITAHALVVADSAQPAAGVLAEALRRSPRPFLPLPVLGVPGWWPANEAPSFYADANVFRPLAQSGRKPSTER